MNKNNTNLLFKLSFNFIAIVLVLFAIIFSQFGIDGECNGIRIAMASLIFLVFLPLSGYVGSFFISTLLIAIFNSISEIKEAATGKPLSVPDILMGGGEGNLLGYATDKLIILVFTLIVTIAILVLWRIKSRSKIKTPPVFSIACSTVSALFFTISLSGSAVATHVMSVMGAKWVIYDDLANKNMNGIVAHLLFSARDIEIPKKTDIEFRRNNIEKRSKGTNPDIFVVMCEACFTDARFKTAMGTLPNYGFIESNVMSPVYGGGTSETEFELLTGFSSLVLPENDYQIYGNLYRDKMDTLPSALKSAGYETHALHNFKSWFWKRNVIYPKMGFDKSIFIESMGPHFSEKVFSKGGVLTQITANQINEGNDDVWPSDGILYRTVANEYNASSNKPQFFFLVTVMTHGPYSGNTKKGNTSEEVIRYKSRMEAAINEYIKFVKTVDSMSRKKGKKSVFIIFGDHKPGITKALIESGIFDKTYIKNESSYIFKDSITKSQNRNIFTVPLYAMSSDSNFRAEEFVRAVEGRPIFCLGAEIEKATTANDDFFSTVRNRCESPDKFFYTSGNWASQVFPTGLIAKRLF